MQIISIISGKGGVGKTTLTANVAVALSQRGKRVLVIDLDPQNSVRCHLGMDPSETAGFVREGICPDAVFDSPFGVKFIPFGILSKSELQEFEASLKYHPQWIRDGIQALDTLSFDFIIVDTPPGPTVYLRQALNAAHRALAVVLADAASFATVPTILSLAEQYTSGKQDFRGLHLLINQMPHLEQLGHQVRSALYEDYAQRIVPAVIHYDPAVSEALAFERPVLDYEPGCEASLDLHHVADWLLASTQQ